MMGVYLLSSRSVKPFIIGCTKIKFHRIFQQYTYPLIKYLSLYLVSQFYIINKRRTYNTGLVYNFMTLNIVPLCFFTYRHQYL